MESIMDVEKNMLEDVVKITVEIIDKQIAIKKTAEKLKHQNEQLQGKSEELQNILEMSRKQLQSESSIPLLMINKLVEEVNYIKKEQGIKIGKLISSVDETNKKFKQMKRMVDQGAKIEKLISSAEETNKQVKLIRRNVDSDSEMTGPSHTFEELPVSKLVKELMLCPII